LTFLSSKRVPIIEWIITGKKDANIKGPIEPLIKRVARRIKIVM
jgi:hypothetical protein